MFDTLDVRQATELLPRIVPELAERQRAMRAAAPTLGDGELLDGALRAALLRLRVVVSRRTFVYLRWMLEGGGRAASVPTPVRRQPIVAHKPRPRRRAAGETMARRIPRLVCDGAGERWVVSEEGAVDPGAGGSRLTFVQARERRSVTVYPSEWRSLSNEALAALLPSP